MIITDIASRYRYGSFTNNVSVNTQMHCSLTMTVNLSATATYSIATISYHFSEYQATHYLHQTCSCRNRTLLKADDQNRHLYYCCWCRRCCCSLTHSADDETQCLRWAGIPSTPCDTECIVASAHHQQSGTAHRTLTF